MAKSYLALVLILLSVCMNEQNELNFHSSDFLIDTVQIL